jgi:hypothetical protein
MRQLVMGAALLLATWPAVGAQENKDKPKANEPSPAAEQLRALTAKFNTAQRELYKVLDDVKTQEEAEKIIEETKLNEKADKLTAEFAKRIFAVAENNASDADVAADALVWVVQHAQSTPEAKKAVDQLIRDHLARPQIDQLLPRMVYSPSESADKLVRAAADKADNAERKATRRYYLATYLKNKGEGVALFKTLDDKTRHKIEQRYGKEYLARLTADDPAKYLGEAETLFDALAKDAGDTKVRDQSIKELAASELYEIRYLAIGKVAPEIEGEDIDAKRFSLSEYRGKVVVLDFWGNW